MKVVSFDCPSFPSTTTDRLWEEYIKRIIGRKKSSPRQSRLFPVLKTWGPESPGSNRFLEVLTRQISPVLWMQWDEVIRYVTLENLIRIDGGRGIIVPWLVSLIKCDDDMRELMEIHRYWFRAREKTHRDELRKAWAERIADGFPGVRRLAWEILTSEWKDETGEGDNAKTMPVKDVERERWLAELICEHLPMESDLDILEIMAQWEPSPGLSPSLAARLVHQWSQKARSMEPFPENSIDDSIIERHRNQIRQALIICQGLTATAAVCPEGEAVVATVLENWLTPKTPRAILRKISTWQPKSGNLSASWRMRWSQLLLVDDIEIQKIAWQVLERETTEDEEPGRSAGQEVWNNCLSRLKAIQSSTSSKAWQQLFFVRFPAGLSPAEQTTWWSRWEDMLNSDNRIWQQAAVVHFMASGGIFLPGRENLQRSVLMTIQKLLTGSSASRDFISQLLENIEKWQWENDHFRQMLVDVWQLISGCGSDYWNESAIETLASKLCHPVPEKKKPCLFPLLLSTLAEKINPVLLWRLDCLWFEKGNPPESLRLEIISIWKKYATCDDPEIRSIAWTKLSSMGDEIGEFLADRLTVENSLEVLSAMALWVPSSESSLPSEFWEKLWKRWEESLIRLSLEAGNCKEINWRRMVDKKLLALATHHPDGLAFFQHLLDGLSTKSKGLKEITDSCRYMVELLLQTESSREIPSPRPEYPDTGCLKKQLIKLFSLQLDRCGEAFWEKHPVRIQANLFLFAAGTLSDSLSFIRRCLYYPDRNDEFYEKESLELICQWYHHENSHPDVSPEIFQSAWNDIRSILTDNFPLHNISDSFFELMKLCHGSSVPAQKMFFYETLEEIRQIPNHVHAQLATLALWREACVALESAICNSGRKNHSVEKIDPLAERRFLREWIHTFLPEGTRREEIVNNDQESTVTERLTNSFGALLWETMEPEISHVTEKKTRRMKGMVYNLLSPEIKDFYRDLQKSGHADHSGRVNETERRQNRMDNETTIRRGESDRTQIR